MVCNLLSVIVKILKNICTSLIECGGKLTKTKAVFNDSILATCGSKPFHDYSHMLI